MKPTTKRPKPTKPAPRSYAAPTFDALAEALEVQAKVKTTLDGLSDGNETIPKFVDAYTRAANTIRQLEKDRKRALVSFTDDEIVDHVRSLPERRREAIITAAQGTSLAGKPLF